MNADGLQGEERRHGSAQQRGAAAAAAGHAEIQDGARHQGEDQSGGLQCRLRWAAEAASDAATGQEALQDWDSAVGYLLHRLFESRARRVRWPGLP
jgi:hypothetical protein